MKYVSVSDARKHFPRMVGQVERTIVLRNNEPVAAIVGFQDFQALVAAQVRERDLESFARLVEKHRQVQAGDRSDLIDFSEGDVDDLLSLADREVEKRSEAGTQVVLSLETDNEPGLLARIANEFDAEKTRITYFNSRSKGERSLIEVGLLAQDLGKVERIVGKLRGSPGVYRIEHGNGRTHKAGV